MIETAFIFTNNVQNKDIKGWSVTLCVIFVGRAQNTCMKDILSSLNTNLERMPKQKLGRRVPRTQKHQEGVRSIIKRST